MCTGDDVHIVRTNGRAMARPYRNPPAPLKGEKEKKATGERSRSEV